MKTEGSKPHKFIVVANRLKELPSNAYTVKVSFGPSGARFYLESSQAVRKLLLELSRLSGRLV